MQFKHASIEIQVASQRGRNNGSRRCLSAETTTCQGCFTDSSTDAALGSAAWRQASSNSPWSAMIRVRIVPLFALNASASLRVTNDPTTTEPSTTTKFCLRISFIAQTSRSALPALTRRGSGDEPHRRALATSSARLAGPVLSQMVTASQALAMPVAQVIIGYPWQVMLLSLRRPLAKHGEAICSVKKKQCGYGTALRPNQTFTSPPLVNRTRCVRCLANSMPTDRQRASEDKGQRAFNKPRTRRNRKSSGATPTKRGPG